MRNSSPITTLDTVLTVSTTTLHGNNSCPLGLMPETITAPVVKTNDTVGGHLLKLQLLSCRLDNDGVDLLSKLLQVICIIKIEMYRR